MIQMILSPMTQTIQMTRIQMSHLLVLLLHLIHRLLFSSPNMS
jgi:hypothetical protein